MNKYIYWVVLILFLVPATYVFAGGSADAAEPQSEEAPTSDPGSSNEEAGREESTDTEPDEFTPSELQEKMLENAKSQGLLDQTPAEPGGNKK